MKTIKLLPFLLLVFLLSCKDDEEQTASLELEFTHQAGTEPFNYEQLYTTEAGNSFSLKLWRTYISKIVLTAKDGSVYEVPESYHLIEPLNDSKFNLILSDIPSAEYTDISFYIGVANEANYSEEIVGDLDPSNNMAWNWTTGYKFIRMDGEFTDASGSRRGVIVHIGTEANLKFQEFTLTESLILGSESAKIAFTVDLLEAFKNPNTIDFEVENDFQFNNEADLIGENYAEGYIKPKR